MIFRVLFLSVFIIFLSCSGRSRKLLSEYRGGVPEVWTKISLFSDSTYIWTYADHEGVCYKDKGKWMKKGEELFLNSASVKKGVNSKKFNVFYFEMNNFRIQNDSLFIIPNRSKGFNIKSLYMTEYIKFK